MKIHLPENQHILVEVTPSKSTELASIDTDEIKHLYQRFGAILFRGYQVETKSFAEFTDHFCSSYVRNESQGRESISSDGRVQTVNLGEMHFPLHPELSREPWQPDIAWFNCVEPSTQGGRTTICDGLQAASNFPSELTEHLMSQRLLHKLPVPLSWCAKYLNKPSLTVEELAKNGAELTANHPGGLSFTVEDGKVFRCYLRPMLHQPMFSEEWAYGNFLVFARRRLGVSYFPCYEDGSEVPDDLVDQLEQLTNRWVHEIEWQRGDLVMLDNTRVMHGRTPIGDPENRKIHTQFGYISFVPEARKELLRQPWRQ